MNIKKDIKEIIFPESDLAAKYSENIKGWVSRNGLFYGNNEELARHDGCTHKRCKICEIEIIEKIGYVICDKCREKKKNEEYKKAEERNFNWDFPLYSEKYEEYFFNENDYNDFLYDYMIDFEGHNDIRFYLRLYICNPQYCFMINPEDIYNDIIPEEDNNNESIPTEVIEAFYNLNKVIDNCKKPVSYFPSKYKPKFI